MLNSFKLLLPAIFPSWNFFDTIAPSPRIELTLYKNKNDTPQHWQEVCPRVDNLSFYKILRRIFFNPNWNETLFLASCAERLIANPTEHSEKEIVTRIKVHLKRNKVDIAQTPYMKFRLVFLYKNDREIERHTAFTSKIYCLGEEKQWN